MRRGDDGGSGQRRDEPGKPQEGETKKARQRDWWRMPKKMKPSGTAKKVTAEMAAAAPATMATSLEEAAPADAFAMGEDETDAGEDQEGRRDAPGVDLPATDGRHACGHIAEGFKIPGEMVARHGDQREPRARSSASILPSEGIAAEGRPSAVCMSWSFERRRN